MTPRSKSAAPKSAAVTIRLLPEQLAALQAIQVRDGIPASEQVRRGIALWLASKAEAEKGSSAPKPRRPTPRK